MRPSRKPLTPLDVPSLEALALRYVERFATTEARLIRYLEVRIRRRGWAGEAAPDPAAVARRLVALGYVDDGAYAEIKRQSLERRGYGARRVGAALRGAGIAPELRAEQQAAVDGPAAALAYARKRRFGRFAAEPPAPDQRRRQFAAMLRAGHSSRDSAAALGGAQPGEDD